MSEACGSNVEDLGFDRGHRTFRIMGKGSKPAVIPLVPRTARMIDLAVGERMQVPILRRASGERLDRRTAHRWVRSIRRRAGLGHVHPHMLRAAFIMAALDAGMPLRDVQLAASHADPQTPHPQLFLQFQYLTPPLTGATGSIGPPPTSWLPSSAGGDGCS